MTTEQYLTDLVNQKNALVTNLVSKGIEATQDEKLNTLVPKVLDIETGDAELEASFISLIDDSLGENCTRLPDSLTSIRQYAFYGCANLALSELPSGITSIGSYSFYGCTGITSMKISSNATKIGSECFRGCTNLTSIDLQSKANKIEDGAFNGCSKLQTVIFPSGLTTIGKMVFNKCTSLVVNEIPCTSLTTIDNYAFDGCSANTKVDIKSTVLTKIGYYAFRKNNLSQFILRVTTPPTISSGLFNETPIASGTGYIYVPDESVETYKSATNWSAYADQIKGVSEL